MGKVSKKTEDAAKAAAAAAKAAAEAKAAADAELEEASTSEFVAHHLKSGRAGSDRLILERIAHDVDSLRERLDAGK